MPTYSTYSNIANASTLAFSTPTHPALRVFALAPAVVFKARVNQATFIYPISQVSYDTVTVGAYADLERGLTILFGTTDGGDDLGRQRTGPSEATATTLYFGRCSEGTHDGEVSLQDDAYITVLNDYRVWSKTPYIEADGTMWKDGTLAVGVSTTTPPPVANAGIPAAGTIDVVTGVLRVRLPSGSQTSFATAAGATITTYAWELPTGVALVAGYALSDPIIEVDCDPGFYWPALAVTDSNGQIHQARTFILADDPDATLFIPGVTVQSHRRTQDGQTLTVQLTQALSPSTYPDGTLVALVDGEPAISADRTNIRFWGWHQSDPASIQARHTGLVRYTQMTCVDMAGRLAALPGFPQTLENDLVRDTGAFPAITWAHMVGLTLDLYLHYLLQWHSTALDLTDYFPTGTTTIYSIGGALGSDGGNLWEQIRRRVKAFVPSKNIGCDLYGRLLVRADPLEEEPAQRTAMVQAALTAADFSELRFTHTRSPGVHWLRGNALQAISPLPVDANGDAYQPTFFAIAPGDVPGQGEIEETFGEHLSPSQLLLNTATGHHYARINARESLFDITLVGADWYDLDPAAMEWVTLTLDAAYAAQRGLSFTAARGLVHEIDYGYPVDRTGVTRTCRIRWERETVGRPALTVTQPDVDPVDDGNDDWYTPPVVPVAPPADLPAGVQVVALLDSTGNLFRTADFQTASGSGGPTWDKVDLATGALYTWIVDPFSPGYIAGAGAVNGWAVDEDDIWRIADIFGATPTATSVLTFANSAVAASYHWRTIQASFGRYFAEGSNPWLLCVSYYGATTGHTGTWATYSIDGGVTWAAEVQVSAEYDTGLAAPLPIGVYASPKTPGLGYTAAFYDTAAPASADGYVTTDWGATWSRLSGTPVDDPAEPLPYWGVLHNGSTSVTISSHISLNLIAESVDGEGVISTGDYWLLLAPPTNAVRVLIEGRWTEIRTVAGDTGGVSFSGPIVNGNGTNATATTDTLSKTTGAPIRGSLWADFVLEYTRNVGQTDWELSRDDMIASSPTVRTGYCYVEMSALVNTNGNRTAKEVLEISMTIQEIELENGHIYIPPALGSGLIQPVHGHAGSIHLPWPDNADEQVAFFGALSRIANREFALMRSLTGTPASVAPNDATRNYGVHRPGFGVRTYDLDRSYAAFAGVGNETSGNAADDFYALYVSSDSGATWTLRDGPDAAATPHASEVAFAADNAQVLISWGSDGYLMVSSDLGATLDSRAGNLATINGGTAPALLIGLAGGPTG